jgi:formiminotetrahydrofolate cyclodeaminase
MVEEFVNNVAAPTPAPGGGSAAALAGALAAGLGEMVCGVSLKRKSLSAHHPALEATRGRLAAARERFLQIVDLDAQSYEAVMRAFKMSKSTEAEQKARDQSIEAASKQASLTPLETAETAAAVAQELVSLRDITIAQAASDLSVALNLAETARRGGIENVQANLPNIHDESWLKEIGTRLEKLGTPDSAYLNSR